MKYLVALTIIVSCLNASAKGKDCTNYDKVSDVSITEMKLIAKSNSATIIDVNSKKSFNKGAIGKAIHFSSNEAHLAKVLPKNKDDLIVAYCGGKSCTAWQRATKAACEMGYTNIKHFSQGIKGWRKNTKS